MPFRAAARLLGEAFALEEDMAKTKAVCEVCGAEAPIVTDDQGKRICQFISISEYDDILRRKSRGNASRIWFDVCSWQCAAELCGQKMLAESGE
jgi:hypothetical protein